MPSDDLKRFLAHFDSRCDECDSGICEGDPIARTPDASYICEDCIDDYVREQEGLARPNQRRKR